MHSGYLRFFFYAYFIMENTSGIASNTQKNDPERIFQGKQTIENSIEAFAKEKNISQDAASREILSELAEYLEDRQDKLLLEQERIDQLKSEITRLETGLSSSSQGQKPFKGDRYWQDPQLKVKHSLSLNLYPLLFESLAIGYLLEIGSKNYLGLEALLQQEKKQSSGQVSYTHQENKFGVLYRRYIFTASAGTFAQSSVRFKQGEYSITSTQDSYDNTYSSLEVAVAVGYQISSALEKEYFKAVSFASYLGISYGTTDNRIQDSDLPVNDDSNWRTARKSLNAKLSQTAPEVGVVLGLGF